MLNALLVAIGGAIGSLVRYGFSLLFPWNQQGFPWATLLSNSIASFILGLFAGLLLQKFADYSWMRYFIVIGFCGGFSTFSSFAFEIFKLNQSDNLAMAGTYALASVLISLGCIVLGYSLTINYN
jgi:fluoride exporter